MSDSVVVGHGSLILGADCRQLSLLWIAILGLAMPKCEGLPNEDCPFGRNDNSVKVGLGDLLLCKSCDTARRQTSSSAKFSEIPPPNDPEDTDPPSSHSGKNTQRKKKNCTGQKPGHKNVPQASPLDTASATSVVLINELLMYTRTFRNNSATTALMKCLSSFYSPDEISAAKKCLVDNTSTKLLPESETLTDRRHSVLRSSSDAELMDIITIFNALDTNNGLDGFIFVAADFNRIPKFGPEELNPTALATNQSVLESKIESLSSKMESMFSAHPQGLVDTSVQNAIANIEKKLESLRGDVDKQLSHFTAVVTEACKNQTPSQKPAEDRSQNVIVFGIEEEKDRLSWITKLHSALHTAAGKDIDLVDAFRLGKRTSPDRSRPILVKLQTIWDKRIILNGAFKLRNSIHTKSKVFIRADETLETRRRKTFAWLKNKAEQSGKKVIATDDELTVDETKIFTLSLGYLNDAQARFVTDLIRASK